MRILTHSRAKRSYFDMKYSDAAFDCEQQAVHNVTSALICTAFFCQESGAGITKPGGRKRGSNKEYFFSVLTEAAGKSRYNKRSDRVRKTKVREEI